MSALAALLALYADEWNLVERETPARIEEVVAYPGLGYLVVQDEGQTLACVLGRACPGIPDAAEMKRLFVHPVARGRGLARQLVRELETRVVEAGFRWLYLDSKDEFTAAIALYRGLGYTPIPRYNDNPEATVFFRKPLG